MPTTSKEAKLKAAETKAKNKALKEAEETGNFEGLTDEQKLEMFKKQKEEIDKLKKAEEEKGPVWDPNDPMRPDSIFLQLDKQHTDPLPVIICSGDFVYDRKIPRGVRVEVPFFVAQAVREMQAQDANTVMLINGLVDQFNESQKALNG